MESRNEKTNGCLWATIFSFLLLLVLTGCGSNRVVWSAIDAPWAGPGVRSDSAVNSFSSGIFGGGQEIEFILGEESIDANLILDNVYRLVKKQYPAMSATAKFTVVSFRPLLVVLSEEKSAYATSAFSATATPFIIQDDLVSDIPSGDPYIIGSRQHVFSTSMPLSDAKVVICKLADGNTKTVFVSDILIDGVWIIDGHEFKFFTDDDRLSIEYVRDRSMQRPVSETND